MMEVEERSTGGVEGDVYIYYLRQASVFAAVFILCSFFFSQATSIGQNFWMTRWAVSDTGYVIGYDENWTSNELLAYFLSIYCGACLLASSSDNVRRLVITLIGLRTSKKLHRRLLDHIVRAPVRFFDVTPSRQNRQPLY